MNTAAKVLSSSAPADRLEPPVPARWREAAPDLEPGAHDELSVLPPARVRYHLARFDKALAAVLANNLACDRFEADNLITQAHLSGFPSLAETLGAVFFDSPQGSGIVPPNVRMAIETARAKIAERLTSLQA